jgi:hypothetical protein
MRGRIYEGDRCQREAAAVQRVFASLVHHIFLKRGSSVEPAYGRQIAPVSVFNLYPRDVLADRELSKVTGGNPP